MYTRKVLVIKVAMLIDVHRLGLFNLAYFECANLPTNFGTITPVYTSVYPKSSLAYN
jgi:hypothetical protein